MPICAMRNCSSEWQPDQSVRMFGLPSIIKNSCDQSKTLSTKRRALWLTRINRNFENRGLTSRNIKVCHKHFVIGRPAALFDPTNPDWAPCLNLGYGRSEQSNAQAMKSFSRYARAKARRQSALNSRNEPSSSSGQDTVVQDIVKVEDLDTEGAMLHSIVDNFDFDGECMERSVGSLVDTDASEEQPDGEGVESPGGSLIDIDASEERPQNPESPSRIRVTVVMAETTDFGCQADMDVQGGSGLRTKCYELFKQNRHLVERMSSMESQLAAFALEKEKLQSGCDSLNVDNINLRGELLELRAQLKRATLSEESFDGDNEKTEFYTGLPCFDVLKIVYDFTESRVPYSRRNAVPKFTEFLMTMMRLRLGCLQQDLAYRFHVSQSTVSALSSKWIAAMTTALSGLIIWPERSVICRTMPSCFKDVFADRMVVIVDCLELFIGKPSSLGPRADTSSQYKRRETVKFLIGITPQGTVSFVSNSYGGRSSDKHMTLTSGILDKLAPGDVILADRGFDIADDVGVRRAILSIPAFTKGNDQLSFDDVQKTREIAGVRVHVQRLIGCVKRKFRILSDSTLNYSYLSSVSETERPSIDGIVKICCALNNLCSPLIPDEKKSSALDQNSIVRLIFDKMSHSS